MKTQSLVISSLFALATLSLGSVGTARAQYSAPVSPAAGPDYNNDGIPDDQLVDGQNAPYYAPDTSGQLAAQTQFGYFGPHPMPHDHGGGFCQGNGAHAHDFPVFDRHLFRESGGYAYFVGDPGDFGYASTSYVYRGHHPLDPSHGGGFCYMDWVHNHWFAPFSVSFSWNSGAFVWGGPWDTAYYASRPFYANYFGGYYRNYYLGGRYFSMRPAHMYMGWGWHRPIARPYGYGWARPVHASRPAYHAPVYRSPIYRAPVYQAPVYRGPMQQAPIYRAPMQQAPIYRAPMQQAPIYRTPMQQAPAFRGGFRQAAPVGHFRRF
ncbi:MAG: hypothetical protein JNJ46_04965 [Myxococcales bacterium]|nr:hypothetical protein [Myxococcales bacterium]